MRQILTSATLLVFELSEIGCGIITEEDFLRSRGITTEEIEQLKARDQIDLTTGQSIDANAIRAADINSHYQDILSTPIGELTQNFQQECRDQERAKPALERIKDALYPEQTEEIRRGVLEAQELAGWHRDRNNEEAAKQQDEKVRWLTSLSASFQCIEPCGVGNLQSQQAEASIREARENLARTQDGPMSQAAPPSDSNDGE